METITRNSLETWENLTLSNNFIFCKVMESNPDLCKHLIEILLHIKIDHLEATTAEKSMQESISSKGVRFDVYTKDDNRIFDVEIQTLNKKNLPQRARYYQSIIDVNSLNSGVNYIDLKTTYIIFICLNDIFDYGLPVYTFSNTCREDNSINLNDGTYKVFFNAKECDKMESDEEKAFFHFLKDNAADDSFTKQLEEQVLFAKKNLEWRTQYMTFKEQFYEEFEEAREIGHEQGYKDGFSKGIEEGIEKGIEKGIKKGLEQGLEQGINEGKIKGRESAIFDTAKNAINLGLSDSQISQITSLPVDEVIKIKNQLADSVLA